MEWETNDEILKGVALRIKSVRKMRKISQEQLAKYSNVSYGSIKRFETTGEISLHSLIKLCDVLDLKHEIKNLFTNIEFKTIEEIELYDKQN